MVIKTLKEAYRYQNFLTSLMRTARYYLNDTGFVTKKKETHNRSKVNPDAADEVIEVAKSRDVSFTPNQVIDFYVAAIQEKEELDVAINLAKAEATVGNDEGWDIDSSLSVNKTKHEFMSLLNQIAAIKPSERKTKGIGYKFNVNGDQTQYCYDIDEVTSIDFDRNKVRNLLKKYNEETNTISDWIDKTEITDLIEFTPRWDMTDSFEDIVSAF